MNDEAVNDDQVYADAAGAGASVAVALQAVGYEHHSDGDEDDVVLPSTVNMGRLNPDTKAHGETSLMWTRDNADFGGGSGAYFKTLVALRNLTAAPRVAALLASLPYGDERSTADDAKIVEGVVGMVLP